MSGTFRVINSSSKSIILIQKKIPDFVKGLEDFSNNVLSPKTSICLTDNFDNFIKETKIPEDINYPLILKEIEVLTLEQEKIGSFCLLFSDPHLYSHRHPFWYFSGVKNGTNLKVHLKHPLRGGCPPYPFEIIEKKD